MNRRQFILAGTATGIAGAALVAPSSQAAEGDGTPLQFKPKAPADPNPLDNELVKYPKCPYCGMDRTKFHYSRHLVHYVDDLVDGTCSIRCAAISFSLNLGLFVKAIYAPDNGSPLEIKPLINADTASYVIGGDFKTVMTGVAKTSFASREVAEAVKGSGEVVDFDKALNLTYAALGDDTKMMRVRRAEKLRLKAMEAQAGAKP